MLCVLYVSIVFVLYRFVLFFFFKQKTAYEMRISDWSSDVCSSDLIEELRNRVEARMATPDSGLSCATALVAAAVNEMRELDDYCGKKYGGKHRRQVN